jgi:hypothetical protein
MAPNRLNARWLRPAFATLALAALAVLGGCGGGSGAPNNPYAPQPVPPGPLIIAPSTITVYANTPASLDVLGGVSPFLVVSSNPTILPLASSTSTGTIVMLPTNVSATASVIITVTDSAGTQAEATVTVQPAPIFNTLTITPANATCGANAVCSGQTATAAVTVTGPGGAGIPGRQVRFDVVTGAFAIQSNDPANPLVQTLTVVSDQFGNAHVIIQANVGAPTQPAFLRATELTTGDQQTAQFTIVQTTNGSSVLSVVPATATITGPDSATCSSGFRVDYFIYGGTPPYTVQSTFPNAVNLLNTTVAASGLPFSAITNGSCVDPLIFTIRDATGLQTTATLINVVGTGTPTTPVSPLTAAPKSQPIAACNGATASELITGGTAPYSISAATVQGVTPIVSPSPLASPGYVNISGMQPGTLPPPPTTYSFIVTDASKPALQATFTIVCNG